MRNTTRPSPDEFASSVTNYIQELNKMDAAKARAISLESLKESGVLDENGRPKELIVTGDVFGW